MGGLLSGGDAKGMLAPSQIIGGRGAGTPVPPPPTPMNLEINILIKEKTWAGGYKTFFMLNSIEHEIFPAHKC